MEYVLILIIGLFLLSTVTPLPALLCFHVAWSGNFDLETRPFLKFLLLIPTTAFPVILLALHANFSHPTWKQHGDEVIYYLAKGSPSWAYYPPFLAGNFLTAIAISRQEFARNSSLPLIGLFTCLLICLFFAIGNFDNGLASAFPLSAGCGYGYGLSLLAQSRDLLRLVRQHLLFLAAWTIGITLTVVANISCTKQMVAELSDEAPDCFIVTAAGRGHQAIVRSARDEKTGKIINGQLTIFREFEDQMRRRSPGLHRITRSIYNVIGPCIAQMIVFRWQADLVYVMLKPPELLIRYCYLTNVLESRHT